MIDLECVVAYWSTGVLLYSRFTIVERCWPHVSSLTHYLRLSQNSRSKPTKRRSPTVSKLLAGSLRRDRVLVPNVLSRSNLDSVGNKSFSIQQELQHMNCEGRKSRKEVRFRTMRRRGRGEDRERRRIKLASCLKNSSCSL